MSGLPIADFPLEDTRQPPLLDQELRRVPHIDEYDSHDTEEVVGVDEADVITSRRISDPTKHRVVLDLDHPAILLDSTTPGHHHLYIDHEMSWESYQKLLRVLAEVGLIEEGYLGSAESRGFTAVRLPWVKKDPEAAKLAKLRCVGCKRHPDRINGYKFHAENEGLTPAEYVIQNEGTYNPGNGHFYCDECYIAAGMPLGVAA